MSGHQWKGDWKRSSTKLNLGGWCKWERGSNRGNLQGKRRYVWLPGTTSKSLNNRLRLEGAGLVTLGCSAVLLLLGVSAAVT